MIGQTIGQYEIIDVISEGGMATVYRAYQPTFERFVALKVLSRQLSEDPTFLRRFQREAKVVARLEHPSIVPVYDHGQHERMPYIVMRLIEGGTLRKKLFYEDVDLLTAAHIVEQVAGALDYAHSQGIIHRDLKPSNILLDDRGNAYLSDFGIAKMLGSTTQVTASGVVGTPSYMSPEQCQGKPLTPASDIYALGAILYEIVTGEPPFEADTPLAVMYMHVKEPVPSVQLFNPALPAGLDEVIALAMDKDPHNRYHDATSLAADLLIVAKAQAASAVEVPDYPAVVDLPPSPPSVPELEDSAGTIPTPDGLTGSVPVVEPELAPSFLDFEALEQGAPTSTSPAIGEGGGRAFPFLAGVLGMALLLGAIGMGAFALSQIDPGSAARVPTLPPTGTGELTSGDVGAATVSPAVTYVVVVPTETPMVGGIIEPTSSPTITSSPPPQPTATSAPARTNTPGPPTNTPFPTNTPLPTLTPTQTLTPSETPVPSDTPTPTATPTLTPTATATSAPTGGSGWVAYIRGINASAEIRIMDANGQNDRALTNNGYYDGEPDWSPGGNLIAYESLVGGDSDIYSIPAAGGSPTQLTTSSEPDRHPDWSPDGSLITFENGRDDTTEIYVMNADGSGLTRLTDNAYGDRAPRFSPDGTRIAYMTEQRGKWEIAVMAYPSGEQVAIYNCPAADCRFPAWAPEGSRIAYNSLDSTGRIADVWLLALSTGESTLLIQGAESGRPAWSGDGRFIFLNRTIEGNADIYRYNIQSGAVERLTTSAADDYAPDWGPS